MIKNVHLFWSGQITGEVMAVTSAHGPAYSLAIHRVCRDSGKVETLATIHGTELQDMRAVVDSAMSLVEYLLDGGSHATWCQRRGYQPYIVPISGPPDREEAAAGDTNDSAARTSTTEA